MAVLDKAEADRCLHAARQVGMAMVKASADVVTLIPVAPHDRPTGGLMGIVFQRRVSSVRLAKRMAPLVVPLVEQLGLPPERALEAAEEYALAAWRHACRRAGGRASL